MCNTVCYRTDYLRIFHLQTSSDGTQSEISGASTCSYMLSLGDIGFFISVSCEPVRNNWARGPTVLSEQIGPIVPGKEFNFFSFPGNNVLCFCSCYYNVFSCLVTVTVVGT